MSNESKAVEILEKYDATHVLVFTTFSLDEEDNIVEVGWGDEGKWRWMARISEPFTRMNDTGYRNMVFNEDTGSWDDTGWNERGLNSVIYKLMRHGQEVTLNMAPSVILSHFELAFYSQDPQFGSLRNYGGAVPVVCVYKINYER